jgi:N-acetylneuraminate synthase
MINFEDVLNINGAEIGPNRKTYFIADIAANHDGDLGRAKELIFKAAEAGADAAKFQHFSAETIVSDYGFKSIGPRTHQANWSKSVFEVYKEASLNLGWTPILKETCDKAGITFFTSPYSIELVDYVDPYVPAYKIGSGDITWLEIIKHIANKQKPYILATGASTIEDVMRAVEVGRNINTKLCLMQCNTNYTGSLENFNFINLNVLLAYKLMYPNMVLGLSDHSPGISSVLGGIALGAKVVEKHFTDDNNRDGPDHFFSLDPITWREMVDRSRELENALGNGVKKVENNELDTYILQRRSICAKANLYAGKVIDINDLSFLRPCPEYAIAPYEVNNVVGKKLLVDLNKGEYLTWKILK